MTISYRLQPESQINWQFYVRKCDRMIYVNFSKLNYAILILSSDQCVILSKLVQIELHIIYQGNKEKFYFSYPIISIKLTFEPHMTKLMEPKSHITY